MGTIHEDLQGLSQLHLLEKPEERQTTWRRSLATLAAASKRNPVPLEWADPEHLLLSVRAGLAHGLFDDLHWLTPASSATALFALATALPRGDEKRELGRMVLQQLQSGDGATFAALAASLATTSPKVLSGQSVQARVAMTMALPLARAPERNVLALSLITGRDLIETWIRKPSMASLLERRSAALVIERAAHEAANRAAAGNDAGIRALQSPMVHEAWQRLLHDREALAWRPIAKARGVLSFALPFVGEEWTEELASSDFGARSRAATSLAASVAGARRGTIDHCTDFLAANSADDGITAAFVYGLKAALESEPESVALLANVAASSAGVLTCEALIDLRNFSPTIDFAESAAALARVRLGSLIDSEDDGLAGLAEALSNDLLPIAEREPSFREYVRRSLDAFAGGGAGAVVDSLEQALEVAEATLTNIRRTDGEPAQLRRDTVRGLRELDLGLLMDGGMYSLCGLGMSVTDAARARVENLASKLGQVLLAHDAAADAAVEQAHPTWAMARLRTLLHLVDSQPELTRNSLRRQHRVAAISALYFRASFNPTAALDRIIHATLARACDAAIRDSSCELSDVFLAIIAGIGGSSSRALEIFGEATLLPELQVATRKYIQFLERAPSSGGGHLHNLRDLLAGLPWESSARVEAMRQALVELAGGMRGLLMAPSIRALAEPGPQSPVTMIRSGCQLLAHLTNGARRRLDIASPVGEPLTGAVMDELHSALVKSDSPVISAAIDNAGAVIGEEIPQGVAAAVRGILAELREKPLDSDRGAQSLSESLGMSWHGVRRSVGNFHILRPLGRGGGGSVYVACRAEHRHLPMPPPVAVKIPQYTGDHAGVLSEEEFLRLFREEAGALLSLPQQDNLAGFITFDLGAKPNPVLVMEYVEGPSLGAVMQDGQVTVLGCSQMVHGIGAGLATMHGEGIAHLDIKPDNIIVRGGIPVLVDFGLAGRKIRPGCATVYYGAPEVWSEPDEPISPTPADVYALACMVFELVTSRLLFDADSPQDCIAEHLRHDGYPVILEEFARLSPEFRPIADSLAVALAPKPERRPKVSDFSAGLVQSLGAVVDRPWPLWP